MLDLDGLTLLEFAGPPLAYFGLGGGVEFVPYFLALLSFSAAALIAAVQWPLRALVRYFRRGKLLGERPPKDEAIAAHLEETPLIVAATSDDDDVPIWLHWLGGFVHRHPRFWIALAQLESSRLARELARVPIKAPIYVCGLARSGSTLLHEVISSHPCVATHRIKDYPMLFTPYWWRRATTHWRPKAPRERPHGDGVMITSESPDALEEMLWMAFFPSCHNPLASGLMGAQERDTAFDAFYVAHLGKLLLADGATRYAAKANYHVARLAYLSRLFPDARFVIPVRSPARHIASLARQQDSFSQMHRKHPRTLAFMRRTGHFEFGLDRRPMNLGSPGRVRQVIEAWAAGDEVRGLAKYWDMVYGYLAGLLASDSHVRKASLIVRFETICEAPEETLRAVLEHCELPDAEAIVQRHAPLIRRPSSDPSNFSPRDLDVIRKETDATARLWGY